MNFAILLGLFLCLQISSSFQLQGAWSLIEMQGQPILYESVIAEITDSVFREIIILQNIVFSGCQSYKYLMETSENNIFIKYTSIQYDTQVQEMGNVTVKCTLNTARMHSVIRNKLVEVFYFQIIGNFLVFLNPNKDILFKFQRVENTKIRNLRGIWNLYNLKSNLISQQVEIADTQITLCKGKLIFGYALAQKYGFKTRLIFNEGCDVVDLQKTFLQSAFSRRIGNSLEIYNSALDLIILMSFVKDLDLSAAEQVRLKAIEEAKVNEEKAAKTRAQAQKKSRTESETQVKEQAQQQTVSLSLTDTKDDLLGLWQPITISNLPIENNSVYFIISSNLISYNGGCNTFQFQYSVVQKSFQQIQIGQNKSTQNFCEVNDDGLYVNGMGRVKNYGISIVGKDFRLKLRDQVGNLMYELRKTVYGGATKVGETQSQLISSSENNMQNQTLSQLPSPSFSLSTPLRTIPTLQPGRYVFLILARRDLPRKFCTITDTKIIYTGCNTIQHTFTIVEKNKIKITDVLPSTANKCSVNNDDIILNAFNSITSFLSGDETGSYVLRNAKNEDVLNLSLF